MQKGFVSPLIIIIIIFSVIFVSAFALVYYLNKSSFFTLRDPVPVIQNVAPLPSVMPTASPSAAPDEIANWKTYTSTQFGVRFKYPPDGTITEGANVLYLTDNSSGPDHYIFTFEIKSNIQLLTERQFIDNEITILRNSGNPGSGLLADKRQATIKNYQNGEINGLYMRGGSDGDSVTDFIKIVAEPEKNRSSIFVFMIHDGNGSVGQFQKNLLEQILSTFNFLSIQPRNP